MSNKHIIAGAALAGLFSGSFAAQAASPASGKTLNAGTSIQKMADKGQHACKGHNECKGQGGCKSGDNGCKGKNSCKGKGGCNTMPKK
ncbi:hypothetical protein SAMN02745166_04673 [Prosthecobacter debontii]|uniref:Low-complexity protein n=1 Tax=Prosthecobacter debontii TaxID=48467 RepID=A0A1T4Z006_9BACT|nr:hypothetical protein [Prosthecobacter debontii]SKB07352.1 hypothetical protein SAMN02745166_04673 [Prosthecobacter debontii]